MDFTLYWFMFPVSILVATLAMLSGIGGAALFTPIFVLLFPLLGPEYALESTLVAITAALITQTFGFLSGFIGYCRRKLIDYHLAGRFLKVSAPVTILGALTAGYVFDGYLLVGYALLVFVLAIGLALHRTPDVTGLESSQHAKQIIDADGRTHHYHSPRLGKANVVLTAVGAFLTGMVSVGIGEVTIAQLTRRGIPIAIAAATSVLVVIVTVVIASTALATQLINAGGWTAVPWNLICYDVPGVLIGGQIGPRLQGRVPQKTMQSAIAVLFFILGIAMLNVALKKFGVI